MNTSSLILVDMDGVIADFDTGFERVWRERYPSRLLVELSERKSAKIADDYPSGYKEDIRRLLTSTGFIEELPEVHGAIPALNDMLSRGFLVYICSNPLPAFENNVLEKYQWVESHLGKDWTRRMIITKDKTLIKGQYLIDNAPEVNGVLDPTWEHIIFDRPYNRNDRQGKRRLTWSNWKDVLL